MNTLSSILSFIANKVGNVAMGTSAATLTGAISETYARTRSVFTKGTYSSQTLYGVTGFMGVSGNVYLTIPLAVASDVSTIAVTSLQCSIRSVSGTYLGGSGGVELKNYISGDPSIRTRQPLVYIHLQNSNFDVPNNTPLIGQVTANFKLS